MLGIQGRVLVGLTTENVARRLIDKAPLQQGLPRDGGLYLIIGGHDVEEDDDGSGWQRKVAQWQWGWRQMMGGGGTSLNDENLISTYFYCSCVENHTTC